jgi:hypothetical protein
MGSHQWALVQYRRLEVRRRESDLRHNPVRSGLPGYDDDRLSATSPAPGRGECPSVPGGARCAGAEDEKAAGRSRRVHEPSDPGTRTTARSG